ncbi:hypothetical protein ACFV3R_16650 [Streptomyces sp. NPDC059740]|uniref:hypothetical protein n=1 Tax=Streptomyces sp. NPDC059740 TaxID=3346926 RepID=UPI003652E3A6
MAAALAATTWTSSSAPARAADYGTPRISLSTPYLSGAVGGTRDPVVTVTVSQSGAAAADLSVDVSAASRPAVAGPEDVAVAGTATTRTLAVTPRARGYSDLTVRVTGLGGKSATTRLHYAASAAVVGAADTRYLTGSSDASAAVDVGDGHTLVADDESNVLRLYGPDGGAPVRTFDVGDAVGAEKEMDLEAGARVGDTVYWTGSMGNNKDGEYKPDRSTLLATTLTGSGAGTRLTVAGWFRDLRADLVQWDEDEGDRYGFADGTADGRIPKEVDGFNVEGLEFLPGSTTTAYVGFRAPLVPPRDGGKALLVPVTNMSALVDGEPGDGHAHFGTPVELDLGGLSVRDIRRDAAGHYLVLAGSWSADDNSAPYALYSWDGDPGHAPVRRLTLPTSDYGAWEAIARTPDDAGAPGARVQLVTDDGEADLYGDGTAAKDLEHEQWQKSRATWFGLGG